MFIKGKLALVIGNILVAAILLPLLAFHSSAVQEKIKDKLLKEIRENAGLDLNIDRLSISLITGKIGLSGVEIRYPDTGEIFFKCRDLKANAEFTGFLSGKIIFEHVKLSSPTIKLISAADGKLASPVIQRQDKALSPSKGSSSANILLKSITINDGKLLCRDQATGLDIDLADMDISADLSLIESLSEGTLETGRGMVVYRRRPLLVDKFKISWRYTQGNLYIRELSLKSPHLALSAEGNITDIEKEPYINMALDFDSRIDRIAEVVYPPLGIQGDISIHMLIRGKLASPTLEYRGSLPFFQIENLQMQGVDFQGASSLEQTTLLLQGYLPDDGYFDIDLMLDNSSQFSSYRAVADIRQLNLPAALKCLIQKGEYLSSYADISLDMQGMLDKPWRSQGHLSVKLFQMDGIYIGGYAAPNADINLTISPDHVRIKRCRAELLANKLDLSGRISLDGEVDLHGSASLQDIGAVAGIFGVEALFGSLDGNIDLKGRFPYFEGTITAQAKNAGYAEYRVDQLEIEGKLSKKAIVFKKLELKGKPLEFSSNLDIKLLDEDDPLAKKRSYISYALLDMKNSSLLGSLLGRQMIKLETSDNNIVFKALLFDEDLFAQGSFNPLDKHLKMAAKIQDIELAPLVNFLGSDSMNARSIKLNGVMGFIGNIGDRNTYKGKLSIDQMKVDIPPIEFSNNAPMVLKITEESYLLEPVELKGQGIDLLLSGRLAADQNITAKAVGMVDLGLMQNLTRHITDSRGRFIAGLVIDGIIRKPVIKGRAKIIDGYMQMPAISKPLRNMNCRLDFDAEGVDINNCLANMGEGRIDLGGEIKLRGLRPDLVDLHLSLANIPMSVPGTYSALFDADLDCYGMLDSMILSGKIDVISARYVKDVELASIVKSFGGKRYSPRGKLPGFLDGLQLEILAEFPEDVLINNNLGRLELQGSMEISGTLGSPEFSGKIDIPSGQLLFKGNQFTVDYASIDFYDPRILDPYFDIRLSSNLSDYEVFIGISGRTNNFAIDARSDPPLSEAGVFSLITTGSALGSSDTASASASGSGSGSSGNDLEAKALSLLSDQLEDAMGKQVSKVMGVDEVKIQSDWLGGSSSSDSSAIIIAHQLGKGLRLSYTKDLSGDNDLVKLEYQVGDNLWISGGRDVDGSLTMGPRFHFEFE